LSFYRPDIYYPSDSDCEAVVESVTKSDITSESLAGSRRAWAVGVIAVWLALSLISASQRYADSLQTSTPVGFSQFLFWSLAIWSY
jgi:hypothetical protein